MQESGVQGHCPCPHVPSFSQQAIASPESQKQEPDIFPLCSPRAPISPTPLMGTRVMYNMVSSVSSSCSNCSQGQQRWRPDCFLLTLKCHSPCSPLLPPPSGAVDMRKARALLPECCGHSWWVQSPQLHDQAAGSAWRGDRAMRYWQGWEVGEAGAAHTHTSL